MIFPAESRNLKQKYKKGKKIVRKLQIIKSLFIIADLSELLLQISLIMFLKSLSKNVKLL